MDGEAAWQAATGCLRIDGWSGRQVDMAAAIPAAVAMGCDEAAAPVLVMAVVSGLMAAQSATEARRKQERTHERDG